MGQDLMTDGRGSLGIAGDIGNLTSVEAQGSFQLLTCTRRRHQTTPDVAHTFCDNYFLL